MKSIEEKAKAYDEAIKKAKGVIEQNPLMEYLKKGIEYIFPELGEDEKDKCMLNNIIDTLRPLSETTHSSYAINSMIAWLEKQGEHANFLSKIQVGDRVTRNEAGVLVNISQLNRVAKKRKNQEEQKPADINPLLSWSNEDEKMFQCLEGIVKDYWAKAEQEKNELKIREASNVSFFLKTIQKSPLCWIKCSDGLPNRDGIYLVVTDGIHNDVYDMARYDSIEGWHKASEIIYWMPIPQLNDKSIIEQKPAEWSEEDEEIVEALNDYVKNLDILFSEIKIGDKDILSKEFREKVQLWLKSLKNRVQLINLV